LAGIFGSNYFKLACKQLINYYYTESSNPWPKYSKTLLWIYKFQRPSITTKLPCWCWAQTV